jgi:hypothetical protein
MSTKGSRHPSTRLVFDETFTTLRGILRRHEKKMKVLMDRPGDYQLGSRQLTDRIGRPLWAAAVQIKKNYVSYHLMPNFKTIDAVEVKELSALTRAGLERIKTITLPW